MQEMEATTTIYGGYMGILEKKMETIIVYYDHCA